MKKHLKVQCVITSLTISFIVCLILCQLGVFYWGKEYIGKYANILPSQYASLNPYENIDMYKLPDQYSFYGRFVVLSETKDGAPIVSTVNDRMVSKCFFEYDQETYFFYYSTLQKIIDVQEPNPPFELIYPDVYYADTDKIAFTLFENPEGCFISDDYIYYAYGKNYYCVRQLDLHNFLFQYSHRKDYHYARLDLHNFKNERIMSKQFIEKREEQHTAKMVP